MNVKELMSELQSKIVLDVKEGQILCPDCKGLRFKYTEKEDSGFITNCTRCHNGKLYFVLTVKTITKQTIATAPHLGIDETQNQKQKRLQPQLK